MAVYVLASVFGVLAVAAIVCARARVKKLGRVRENPDRPAGPVVSDFPDDVFGSQANARKRREDVEKRRLYEEAKRQRLVVAQTKRLKQDARQRVRRYRRWWLKAVAAVLVATAVLGFVWAFLDARDLVPQSVQNLLSMLSK